MNALTRAWGNTKLLFADQKAALAQRLLENKIKRALEIMDGHRSIGVKPGNARYQSIWRVVSHDIDKFCADYKIDRTDIEAQVPGIRTLELLANPELVSEDQAPLMLGRVLIGLGVLVGASAFAGLCYAIFLSIAHHWGR
jgi:hypothetical protein